MVPNQESRIHAHEPKERRRKGKLKDFSIGFDSNQENTQDRFLNVPATFLLSKIHSKQLQIKNHEIDQKEPS
jgi:hypothetical protein